MAFIDTDEFLVLRDGTPDLPALVRTCCQCRLFRMGHGLVAVAQVVVAVASCRWYFTAASLPGAAGLPTNCLPCPSRVQLKDYLGHGGLVVNWQVFGSGGLKVCLWGEPRRWARRTSRARCTACPQRLPSPPPSPEPPPPSAAPQGQLDDVLLALQPAEPPRRDGCMRGLCAPAAPQRCGSRGICRRQPIALPLPAPPLIPTPPVRHRREHAREEHCAAGVCRGELHRPPPFLLPRGA